MARSARCVTSPRVGAAEQSVALDCRHRRLGGRQTPPYEGALGNGPRRRGAAASGSPPELEVGGPAVAGPDTPRARGCSEKTSTREDASPPARRTRPITGMPTHSAPTLHPSTQMSGKMLCRRPHRLELSQGQVQRLRAGHLQTPVWGPGQREHSSRLCGLARHPLGAYRGLSGRHQPEAQGASRSDRPW
jgi:hypothetical protein